LCDVVIVDSRLVWMIFRHSSKAFQAASYARKGLDKLELQLLHGFIAATKKMGRWDGGSEREGTVWDVRRCNEESATVEIKEQETHKLLFK
jgi:hypothetical protein